MTSLPEKTVREIFKKKAEFLSRSHPSRRPLIGYRRAVPKSSIPLHPDQSGGAQPGRDRQYGHVEALPPCRPGCVATGPHRRRSIDFLEIKVWAGPRCSLNQLIRIPIKCRS